MPCYTSCFLASVFLFATIFTCSATHHNKIIQNYQKQLSSELVTLYRQITDERKRIYYYGYALGLVLSCIIIFYNINVNDKSKIRMTNMSMVCVVVIVSFITNYFYYMLSPKTTYMLEHIKNPEQTKAWLEMYKAMQYYWHAGFVFGIIAVGFLAFAFRVSV
jgi:hypothetical protein